MSVVRRSADAVMVPLNESLSGSRGNSPQATPAGIATLCRLTMSRKPELGRIRGYADRSMQPVNFGLFRSSLETGKFTSLPYSPPL